MKLKIEIEVSENDLDAVGFACELQPKTTLLLFKRLQTQVNAQYYLIGHAQSLIREIIRNSHETRDAYRLHEKEK